MIYTSSSSASKINVSSSHSNVSVDPSGDCNVIVAIVMCYTNYYYIDAISSSVKRLLSSNADNFMAALASSSSCRSTIETTVFTT